ncbi:MAG: hypothetical protein GY869_12750 [Planctomycetes bacterium]|nr:hypothetical protein [Planctomycetota bacterium]
MLEELNRELVLVLGKRRAKEKLVGDLGQVKEALASERERLVELEGVMKKEGADVEKLEGLSLAGLFYHFLGDKQEKLMKEREEFLTAKLKFDECRAALAALEKEEGEMSQQVAVLGDLEGEYARVLAAKERVISEAADEGAAKLIGFSEELAGAESELKELDEALEAGRAAMAGVEKVLKYLGSAKGWGTFDMLGGGLIATAVKHSKMDSAREAGHEVQQLLRRFQRELADVGGRVEIDMEIGSFNKFADYFFDGLIFDWVVQSKIAKSLENTEDMQKKLEGIVGKLERSRKEVETRVEKIGEERRRLLEKY